MIVKDTNRTPWLHVVKTVSAHVCHLLYSEVNVCELPFATPYRQTVPTQIYHVNIESKN